MLTKIMKYELVCGLEIHMQSKTKSKMFCGCSADYFGEQPNTYTCPVCLGLPGALPVPNKRAIEKCISLALELNCKINKSTKFDRKNYFYPDLPKGFQISQYDEPIGENGKLEINIEGDKKTIDIRRVHQEEDVGKSVYSGGQTLLDYNKSGVPLIEIVTEADFRCAEEVVVFTRKLRQIARFLDISDCDMEKGQMRIEPNISVRPEGQVEYPNFRVEVKNIGSIAVLKDVIEKEFERQVSILETGKTPVQETRGLKNMTGDTFSMRKKETEADYRYFPEPDIPPIEINDKWLERIKSNMNKSPDEIYSIFVDEYSIPEDIADIIIADFDKAKLLTNALNFTDDKKVIEEVYKWIIGDVAKILSNTEINIPDTASENLVMLSQMIIDNRITRTVAKDIVIKIFKNDISPEKYASDHKLEVISDKDSLTEVIDKVIDENPGIVEDTKSNPNAIMALVGKVMKEMNGQADAQKVNEILREMLSVN